MRIVGKALLFMPAYIWIGLVGACWVSPVPIPLSPSLMPYLVVGLAAFSFGCWWLGRRLCA